MNLRTNHHGLTLLELLIVLGLIAVLSSVALQSVAGLFEERRYDANLDQLEELEKATLGESRFAPSGFAADIGRLPVVVGTDSAATLAELWEQGALPAYAIATAPGDPEVNLGAGWRGPYLNLGITRTSLYDGFGFTFLLYQADGNLADDPGETIAIIQSTGADNAAGGADFDTDQQLIFQADAGAVMAGLSPAETNRWQTELTVQVAPESGQIEPTDGSTLYLRVYGPDGNGQLATLQQLEYTVAASTPSHTFVVPALPLGPKVFRAYQTSTAPADNETPITATKTSAAFTSTVTRASDTLDLVLF